MMPDQISAYLDALARDENYRVDSILKDSNTEVTQRVYFLDSNGAEQGPFIRKYINSDSGLGSTYERVWEAQQSGQKFLYLPNIVDCYTVDDKRVVIMEYVTGETLAEIVERCGPSLALAHDIFPRICAAVSELHELFVPPIIHRDLKPSNIILSQGRLTIIDLGIARSFNEGAEDDTSHFGTRAYAPPEQFGYAQTDVRSDVYAVGLLLYFCLTAQTPDTAVRKQEFQDARVPEQLRRVIVHATAFNPADRFQSVRELNDAYYNAVGLSSPTDTGGEHSSAQRVDQGTSFAQARDGVKGSRVPHSAIGRFLSRIPFSAGVVWDIVIALVFVFGCIGQGELIYGVFQSAAAIDSESASRIASLYAARQIVLILLVILPMFYMIADRRPLVRLIPPLGRISLRTDIIVCAIVFFIGAIVYNVIDGMFIT